MGYVAFTGPVTADSATNPVQITSAAHGLETGATVIITGSSTTPTTINGSWTVTVIDANHFTIPANGTGNTPGNNGVWSNVADARYGRSGNITGNTAAVSTVITSVAHGLSEGDTIAIVDTNSIPVIDGTYSISGVTPNTFIIPATVTTPGTSGTWTSGVAANYPTPTVDNDTSITKQQSFYDDIVNLLLTEPVSKIDSAAQTAATFVNSTQSQAIRVSFTVPQGIAVTDFYQVYRTRLSIGSDVDPGDEEFLAFEGNPTSGEIAAKLVSFIDVTPESFLGAALYTNANQEGILQQNDPPPLATDMTVYKNIMFYSNTSTLQSLNLSLLTSLNFLPYNGTIENNTVANPTVVTSSAHGLTTGAVISITGSNSAPSLNGNRTVTVIDSNTFSVPVNVTVAGTAGTWSRVSLSGSITGIGIGTTTTITSVGHGLSSGDRIIIESSNSTPIVDGAQIVTVTGANTFTIPIAVTVAGTSGTWTRIETSYSSVTFAAGTQAFTIKFGNTEDALNGVAKIYTDGTPAQNVDSTARSLIRAINRYTNPGQNTLLYAYYTSDPTSVPGAILLQARNLSTGAFVAIASDTTTGKNFNPVLPTLGASAISTNDTKPNRLYYSKLQQPEAVPILNYFDVGAQNQPIVRIVALRDSLFVFKTDGIYRVSGETTQTLQLVLFDNSTRIIAGESPAIGSNQIYVLTDQGVVRCSDSGVSVISRPIENQVIQLNTPLYPNFQSATFGIYYSTQRKYYLWTVTNLNDVYATQCFVYNTFTNAWTRLPIEKTCAVIHTADGKMYLGAGDINAIEQERKNFDYTDYADRQYQNTIAAQNMDTNVLTLNSLTNVGIGDLIAQQVFLTPFRFNRVLINLDSDPAITSHNYFTTYQATLKADLDPGIAALLAALNTPGSGTSGGYTIPFNPATSPQETMANFNAIVNQLNTDPDLALQDYPLAASTTTIQDHILSIDTFHNQVTVEEQFDWDLAPVTVLKAIATTVAWAPAHAGDPSIIKQFRESNLMFSDIISNVITLSYKSDLQRGFEAIPFASSSAGEWGDILWGNDPWGGYSEPRTFRTYIPQQKQRCRYLNPKFDHARAYENYLLVGLSLTFDPVGERVTR